MFGHLEAKKLQLINKYCKINVLPFKKRFNSSSENKSRIYSLPFVSGIFHWYKYCKQRKSLCLKTLFSSILSWNDQKKYKKIKITYLFHCPFSWKTLIKSKQIHFYVFLSRIWTWTCRCQKQLKLSKPKRLAYNFLFQSFSATIFMKKAWKCLLKLHVFLCCFIFFKFQLFNFCQPQFLSVQFLSSGPRSR
jgi:hypothetical protein